LEAAAGHVREFERMLVDEGTAIVKVFLNVSKDE
jgi:polyphosphate kinase 2 (PPK2 family)